MTPLALGILTLAAAAAGYLCGRASAVRGEAKAWADGYAAGTEAGAGRGKCEGYDAGFRDAWEATAQGRQQAYLAGYEAAVRERPPLKRLDVNEMRSAN